MSTTWPYKPSLFVAGTRPAAADFDKLVRFILGWQGAALAGDQARPAAVLKQTVVQSIANNTSSPILFDAEDLDTLGGHSTTSNTSRWTCPASCQGWYRASGVYTAAANGTGSRQGLFRVNGSNSLRYGENVTPPSSTIETAVCVSDVFYLNAGDYVELMGFQSSGGSLNTALSAVPCRMTIFQELAI